MADVKTRQLMLLRLVAIRAMLDNVVGHLQMGTSFSSTVTDRDLFDSLVVIGGEWKEFAEEILQTVQHG